MAATDNVFISWVFWIQFSIQYYLHISLLYPAGEWHLPRTYSRFLLHVPFHVRFDDNNGPICESTVSRSRSHTDASVHLVSAESQCDDELLRHIQFYCTILAFCPVCVFISSRQFRTDRSCRHRRRAHLLLSGNCLSRQVWRSSTKDTVVHVSPLICYTFFRFAVLFYFLLFCYHWIVIHLFDDYMLTYFFLFNSLPVPASLSLPCFLWRKSLAP